MSEFVMEGRDHAVRAECPFVLGFIEAMFFTECSYAYDSSEWFTPDCKEAQEQGQADGTLPGDVGYCDLHTDSLARIRAFCAAFQRDNAPLLARAYARPAYDVTQAGRDLWFTSQGRGVGFWDRAVLGADGIGVKLSDAVRYHEAHIWFGDHVTFGNAPFVHVEI